MPITLSSGVAWGEAPWHNGLSQVSLADNALTTNPKALAILTSSPLTGATFNAVRSDYPEMRFQLRDARARDVMTDLVACALAPGQSITYKPTPADPPRMFSGEMGLCEMNGDHWSTQRPSSRCLQLVSACLLARVNALHRSVPISMRGPSGLLPPLRTQVTAETSYREGPIDVGLNVGTPMASFAPTCGPSQSCGWEPQLVGVCAGTSGIVPVTISQTPLMNGTCAPMRACVGPYGCDEPSQHPEYSRALAASAGTCSLSFECPAGTAYSLMTQGTSGALHASVPLHPAPEPRVFPFREGAFFGTLFAPDGLTRTREVVNGANTSPFEEPMVRATQLVPPTEDAALPYRLLYVCYSPEVESQFNAEPHAGVAYFNDRICAEPGARCFANPPMRCDSVCTWVPGDGSYHDCAGGARIFTAITTFLDQPCSLADDQLQRCRPGGGQWP